MHCPSASSFFFASHYWSMYSTHSGFVLCCVSLEKKLLNALTLTSMFGMMVHLDPVSRSGLKIEVMGRSKFTVAGWRAF